MHKTAALVFTPSAGQPARLRSHPTWLFHEPTSEGFASAHRCTQLKTTLFRSPSIKDPGNKGLWEFTDLAYKSMFLGLELSYSGRPTKGKAFQVAGKPYTGSTRRTTTSPPGQAKPWRVASRLRRRTPTEVGWDFLRGLGLQGFRGLLGYEVLGF